MNFVGGADYPWNLVLGDSDSRFGHFSDLDSGLITTLNKSIDLSASKSLLSEARSCDSALDLCIVAQQAVQLATEDETRKRLENIAHVLSNNSIRFEWIDSPFVQAYLQGDWILIQDVNCCSAAVLDRLNTCLEKDGELVVRERTQDQTTPLPRHPNFRVFFSMDPRNGPLSRAMRNRSVEIFVGDDESWNKNAVDSLSIVLGANNAVLDVSSEEDKKALLGALEGLSAKQKLQLNSLAPSQDASEWMVRVKSLTLAVAPSFTTELMDTSDVIEDVTTTEPPQTIIAVSRPTLTYGCSELAEYYSKCWSAVSRLCTDPASAFFFAALFAEDGNTFPRDKFTNIGSRAACCFFGHYIVCQRYPTFSAADALIVLQEFYTKVVAKVYEAEQKPMDAIKCLVEHVNSTSWSTILDSIEAVQQSLTDHVLDSEDLLRARDLSSGLSAILNLIIERVVLFLDWFATFYLTFESLSAHLLRKGFVNPIPKVDNSAEGQGSEMDGIGDENCGMGEGEGAKDVSEEIEENGDDDSEEAGEENADWNVGDVEEPEDRQLDPELWEKPKEDAQRNLDEESKGAQEETDEIAAKEEESNAVTDPEQAEKPTPEGQKEDQEQTKDVDGEELDATENVDEINLDDADSDHEENFQQQDTNDEEAADGEANEDEGPPEPAEPEVGDAEQRTSDDEKSQEEESVDATTQEQMDEDNEARAEHAETDTSAAKQHNVQAMENESKATSGERDADVEQENREEFTDANEGKDGDEETDRSATAQKHQLHPRDETTKDTRRDDDVLEDAALEADQPKTTAADENIEVEMGDVEPTAEEEDLDENSDKLAHIGDQDFRPQDKHVVKKSTIEEAFSTRSQFDRMKNKETLEKVHREKEVGGVQAEDDLSETETNEVATSDRMLPSSVINMNFERLTTIRAAPRKIGGRGHFRFRAQSAGIKVGRDQRRSFDAILCAGGKPAYNSRANSRIQAPRRLPHRKASEHAPPSGLHSQRLSENRIWMRRTKKAQRNYQICLAVDDSASMKENLMTEMTCEAVCLIERALRQLEVGELSVCKFGTTVKVLSEFTKGFDESLGPRLLEELSFEQDKTDLGNLLGVMDEHFTQARDVKTSNQMLIILGDGRGVLADGLDRVRSTRSRLMDHQVTVLYVIIIVLECRSTSATIS